MYKRLIDYNEKENFVDENGRIRGWIPESENACKVEMGECIDLSGNVIQKYWISFDEKTLNFHIVPQEERDSIAYGNIRKQINGAGYVRSGNAECTKQHKWIEVKQGIFSFVLGFQTLAFEGDKLNCYLDKIQFYAMGANLNGPNFYLSNGEFEAMYPPVGDGNLCMSEGKVVYNSELTIKDAPKVIARSFQTFIEKSKKIFTPKTYH